MIEHDYFLPFPEIVDRGPGVYRIRDSSGMDTTGSVDKLHRRLWVPLRPDGGPVVRHEFAHILWSPEKFPPFHPAVILQAVEDARINLGLVRVGLPVDLDAEQRAHVALLARRDLKSGRGADFLLRCVASLGTSVEDDLAELAAEQADDAVKFAAHWVAYARTWLEERRRPTVAPFSAALELARTLARAIAARGALDPRYREIELHLSCVCEGERDERVRMRRAAAGEGVGAEGGPDCAPMEIVEAPLEPAKAAKRGLQRGWRATPEGSQPGALHRWALDRAVFRRAYRHVGGSVLIDTSGSMSFGNDDLDALVDASRGAALIAIYSGQSKQGQLRIVARAGMRAAPDHLVPYGHGNVVDEPALRWLARQRAPRYWVSDGGVSGVGDRSSAGVQRRCAEICRVAEIRRFPSAGVAVRELESGAPGRRRLRIEPKEQ